MAEVVGLFVSPQSGFPMQAMEEVRAIADRGLQGCAHSRPGGRRQVLLMDAETVELLGIEPGQIKENILCLGLDLKVLESGQRLRVGESLLEVTLPCTPCHHMDEIRPGLQEELRGRRGTLCRVIQGGVIRRGDRIEVLQPVRTEA